MDILGIFEICVVINDKLMHIKFHIVPNNRMIVSVISNTNILTKSGLKIEFINNKVSIVTINKNITTETNNYEDFNEVL